LRLCCAGIVMLGLSASLSRAEVLFYTNRPAFLLNNQQRGSVLRATETFEEAVLQSGKAAFPDPLVSGVPNSVIFPAGLAVPNLTIQTNRLPGPLAPLDAPSGNAQALFAVAAGALGTNSVKVGEDLGILYGISCSIDVLFGSNDLTAVSLNLSRFQAFGTAGWHIGVFDIDDNLIGSYRINGPVAAEPAKNFFGVWSSTPIARINLFDLSPTPSPDAVDNIELWVPAPAGALLLAGTAGWNIGMRRRRR